MVDIDCYDTIQCNEDCDNCDIPNLPVWSLDRGEEMIVDKNHPPNLTNAIEKWERGLDPWHRDAFPDEFKYAGTIGKRKEG